MEVTIVWIILIALMCICASGLFIMYARADHERNRLKREVKKLREENADMWHRLHPEISRLFDG